MDKGKERRGTYFIKTPFQVRFILKFTLLLMLGLILSAVMFYLMSNRSLTETMSYAHTRRLMRNTYELLLPSVIITTLISAVIITVVGMFVFIRVSHKLAGPLLRFERRAERISQGDLTEVEVKLRKNDEIAALGESFSQMTKTLKEQITQIQRQTADLSAVARELENNAEKLEPSETKELAEKLNGIVKRIKTSADYFKV